MTPVITYQKILTILLVILLANAGSTSTAQTISYKIIYNFNNVSGGYPVSEPVMDAQGNIYGTTSLGGGSQACISGCGTIYQLSPPATGKGAWKHETLARFNVSNGSFPYGRLLLDAAGNIYGTTSYGGDMFSCPKEGCGTVFKLSRPAPGKKSWVLQTLVQFNVKNGYFPYSGLIGDPTKSLYGTTAYGGDLATCPGFGCGTVYKLVPPATRAGAWQISSIAVFNKRNGKTPVDLVQDAASNLYGTTSYGGNMMGCFGAGCGTVYQLSPPSTGHPAWKFKTIIQFNGKNGGYNGFFQSKLALDPLGILFGVTWNGGDLTTCAGTGCGTVFKLTPPVTNQASWTLDTLAQFNGTNGNHPNMIMRDSTANLYGTTWGNGSVATCTGNQCGTLYQLTPPMTGQPDWKLNTLIQYVITNSESSYWPSNLFLGTNGRIYGTTEGGGKYGAGTLFTFSN